MTLRASSGGGDKAHALIPNVERTLTTSNQRIDAETETLLVAHTLRGEGFDAGEDGTGRGTPLVPIAFADNSRAELRLEGGDGQRVGAISTGGGKPGQGVPMIAVADTLTSNWHKSNGAIAGSSAGMINPVFHGAAVRRLTPRECERLQGFPDDYTLINVRGKPAADGPRYKALGNSMAVPVMHWIGRRIQLVDAA